MNTLEFLCCVRTNLEFLSVILDGNDSEKVRELVDETQRRIERDEEDKEVKKKKKLWE